MIVPFLFFEKANFPSVRPVLERLLEHPTLEPVFVKGFDFKEYSGQIAPFAIPSHIPHLALDNTPIREPNGARWRDAVRAQLDAGTDRALCDALAAVIDRDEIPMLLERASTIAAELERFIARTSPRIAVLPEDTDYIRGRLAAQILRRHGVRTVVLMPTFYNLIVHYPRSGPRLADHYFVMNETVAAELIADGVDPSHVVVCGSAALEAPAADRRPSPRPTFVYVLQDIEWERIIAGDLVGLFRRRPDLDLVIKYHPASRSEYLHDLASNSRNIRCVPDGAIDDLLHTASCVISQSSSVLYQAVGSGIPIIVASYGSFPVEIRLPASGAHVVATNPAELRRLVDACAAGELASPDAVAYVGPRGAVETIVHHLERVAAGI